MRNKDKYEKNTLPQPSPFSQAHLGSMCCFSVEKLTHEAKITFRPVCGDK